MNTPTIETKSEDEILNASIRLKVLNLTREGMRNAPQVRAIVQQLRVLVVGLQGGKLTMTTEDEDWNKEAQEYFAERSKAIDFIDNTGLNDCLKLMLTARRQRAGTLPLCSMTAFCRAALDPASSDFSSPIISPILTRWSLKSGLVKRGHSRKG